MSANTDDRKMAKKRRKTSPKYYSKGRVKRGPAPLVQLKRTSYRKALPELRRDFEDRCAYCMRRIGTETEMHVDHFDPRKKKLKRQEYSNLFLADAHCNCAKGDTWPTTDEQAAGCRFLNCCDEYDYGTSIFEDPTTHELVGTSPAATYHIEIIDLNDPGLIEERRSRAEILGNLAYLKEKSRCNPDMTEAVEKVLDMAKDLIPDIPGPPGYWMILDDHISNAPLS